MINKQQYEAQLQHIFRLLLENKTQEEIAHELNISTRTVARYSQRIDKRYGEVQRQKNDDILFLECHLFKNRMLNLYKALENKVRDDKTSGVEKSRCAEIAANIALDVLKLESEGIRAVKEGLVLAANKNTPHSLNNNLRNENDDAIINNNQNHHHHQEQEDDDLNRKF